MDATSRYRPQIDGLRAISILAVVGYHTALPGFSGGFVGVDVFFVISGYLILGQIGSRIADGRFSLAAFYGRRFLRILPGLALMLAASAVAARFVLVTPDDIREFRHEIVQAALMYANHHFLVSEGDYFGRAIQVKPLLHTWSLMVEEQFYLAAPLLAMGFVAAARRFGGLGRTPLLRLGLAFAGVSLVASAALSNPEHNVAFFLTPFRAWEFAVGGLVHPAAPHLARLSQRARAWLAPLGLALIALAANRFGVTTPYPSLGVALPVAGAALVIAGSHVGATDGAARLLSSRGLTAIGLLSYEWYLWHWPLLVYGRLVLPEADPLARDLAAVTIALGLAFVTYRFIDRPIRRFRPVLLRRPLAVVASAAAALVALAVVSQRSFLEAQHVAAGERARWIESEGVAAPRRCDGQPGDASCAPHPAAARSVIVAGDSHAGSFAPALASAASESGVSLVHATRLGCLALSGVEVFRDGAPLPACRGFWEETLEKLEGARPPARSVLLMQNWAMYLGGEDELGRKRPMEIGPAGGDRAKDPLAFLRERLSASLDALEAAGAERILLVGAIPNFDHDPVDCVMRARRFAGDLARCRQDAPGRSARAAELRDALASVVSGHASRRWIDPSASLCGADHCRALDDAGRLLYVDTNHVSRAGAARIYADFEADLDWALGRR